MDFLDLEGKGEEDIICDVFDLNGLQEDIFDELQDSKMTVQELASEVDRNRSTVQRALQEMLEKDIVMREGRTDRTVYYIYTTLPMEEIKELTVEVLDQWHENVTSRLS